VAVAATVPPPPTATEGAAPKEIVWLVLKVADPDCAVAGIGNESGLLVLVPIEVMLHWENVCPASGVAVSCTDVPAAMLDDTQLDPPVPQLIPPTLLVTVPPEGSGVIVSVTAGASVARRSDEAARTPRAVAMHPDLFMVCLPFGTGTGSAAARRSPARHLPEGA
jgi:hypothetical protein